MRKITHRLGFAAAMLLTAFASSPVWSQTVEIDPAEPIGPTIKRAGWDIKQNPLRLNSDAEVRRLYQEINTNFLRIPIFATAHTLDDQGNIVVDESAYQRELGAIAAVVRGRPDVEIYASLKLQGADTFPEWVSEPTAAWPASTGRIFGNTVDRPNPEHYSDLIANFVKYMQDNGVRIDFIGLNNETEGAVTAQRYIGTYDLLPAALAEADVTAANSDFQFVGPDSFGIPTAENFMQILNDQNRLDAIDIAASHYYPQFGSGNESDWEDLQRKSQGKQLWHTEVHLDNESRFIDVQSQSVRNSLSVLFASFRNGVDSYVWWEPPNTIDTVNEVVKTQINDTVLGATPVFTTPSYAGKGDRNGEPLFQAFENDGHIILWIVNPGDEIVDLPVELMSSELAASPTGVNYLAPNGDASFDPSETLTLGITDGGGGVGFTIESIAAQSIAVVSFSTMPPTPLILGDMNGDGEVNNSDISAFAMALFTPTAYGLMYPGTDPDVVGDFSGDGTLNNSDIAGFAAILFQ